MKKTNLEISEFMIAKILIFLLDKGVQEGIDLDFGSVNIDSESEPFFNGCCLWLLGEGIIRGSNNPLTDDGNFLIHNAMITARGLGLLEHPGLVKKESLAGAL